MKNRFVIVAIGMICLWSCDPEPTGPETDCNILQSYKLKYYAVDAAKVFDLRTDPPKEIRNGSIEYDLSSQLIYLHGQTPTPYPYSDYFIDSIAFINDNSALVRFFEQNATRTYSYERDDCQIELRSEEGDLHLELTAGGEEISEKRFAIYDHKMPTLNRDTFLFIEFRLGAFSTYEEVIKQFAADNSGQYDTIAIELVNNRTKE